MLPDAAPTHPTPHLRLPPLLLLQHHARHGVPLRRRRLLVHRLSAAGRLALLPLDLGVGGGQEENTRAGREVQCGQWVGVRAWVEHRIMDISNAAQQQNTTHTKKTAHRHTISYHIAALI